MILSEDIISGQNFAAKCDYVFSQMKDSIDGPVSVFAETIHSFRAGEVVFCKTDYIKTFHQILEKYIPTHIPFSMVTHDSDYCVTEDMFELFSNRPIKWYGINSCTKSVTPIPLGTANTYCRITMKAGDFQKAQPHKLLYVNHRVDTYSAEREWLYPYFSGKNWCTVRHPFPKGEIGLYKQELLSHKFILCPRGNGIDTHRLWESLYCGVIPIVKRHWTHSYLDGNLPVLFVDDFSEVTEALLNETYETYKTNAWNWDMLNVNWWIDRMKRGL